MRAASLLIALATWPAIAGAAVLFLINGLGGSGAFTESPSTAWRSLALAIREGFWFGVRATPFLSVLPALVVFLARRFIPKTGSDVLAGALGGLLGLALLVGWTLIEPLDPLLAGILVPAGTVLMIGGAITGVLIALLRPTVTLPTSTS